MNYLTAGYLIWLNGQMLSQFGGFCLTLDDNVANRDSLEYLVEAVPGQLFGQELYEGLYRKAAAYAYYIIRDHIFHDGNKRTGMQAALVFLEANASPPQGADDEAIVKVAIELAEESIGLDELAAWLERICLPPELGR